MDWTKIEGERLERLRQRMGRDKVQIDVKRLPFYEHGDLACVVEEDFTFYSVVIGDILVNEMAPWVLLDGNVEAIRAANDAAGLKLDADNVRDYLRFFCGFLHGECGPFTILDEDLVDNGKAWPVSLPVFAGKDGDDYICQAHVYNDGAVFWADFRIERGGAVHMVKADPVEPLTIH